MAGDYEGSWWEMNLQGIELISRHTKSAAKVLLVLSSGLLVIAHYGFNLKAWNFFNRDIQPHEFREIATIVVLFSMVSLVVHWVSDYMAYTKWFQTNRLNADGLDAIGSFRNGTVGAKDALITRIDRLKKNYKEYFITLGEYINANREALEDTAKIKERLISLEDSLKNIHKSQEQIIRDKDELAALLEDIGPGFKKVSYAGFFLIYIWYLALPLLFALAALIYMWLNAGAS